MNMDKIIEFYNNNKDTINIIVATAFISSLITWLFTKLLPSFSSFFSKLSDNLIQKIGGQLAYRAIRGKYLNWVVLHNQDLNLTGVIGTGQKPRLEQIFISLKVTRESTSEETQTNQSTKAHSPNYFLKTDYDYRRFKFETPETDTFPSFGSSPYVSVDTPLKLISKVPCASMSTSLTPAAVTEASPTTKSVKAASLVPMTFSFIVDAEPVKVMWLTPVILKSAPVVSKEPER